MRFVRGISAVLMIIGLIVGSTECSSIMDRAESGIHEIFAIATAVAYFTGFYILARALELLGRALISQLKRDRRSQVP